MGVFIYYECDMTTLLSIKADEKEYQTEQAANMSVCVGGWKEDWVCARVRERVNQLDRCTEPLSANSEIQ